MMPWRMLEYMVRLWRQWLNEHPGARVLPSIIPVVLYHGRYRWRVPTRFEALLNLERDSLEAVRPHQPSFEFILEDLGTRSESVLLTEVEPLPPVLALTLMMFRTLRGVQNPTAALVRWAHLIGRLLDTPNARFNIHLVFSYIENVREDVDPVDLTHQLASALDERKQEALMRHSNPHVQALIDKGLVQGREEGQSTERAELLMAILTNRFSAEAAEPYRDQVAAITSEGRYRFIEAIMAAEDITEIF